MVAQDGFAGTAATVRRALAQAFAGGDPGDATWRGSAGPRSRDVRVDVEADDAGQPIVVARGVVAATAFDANVARACLLENDPLLLGRFGHRGDAVVLEQSLRGGPTMHVDEVRLAVWSVGWGAGAFAERFAARLRGASPAGPPPFPEAAARRGAEDRLRSTEDHVERYLAELYGTFSHHDTWGYHGGFGSARVFVSTRHVLEVSTAITVASPILLGVELSDELALAAHALQAREHLGRLVYVEDRGELWVEHGLVGDDLQRDELGDAVAAVARIADGEDDRLQAAFGGRRYVDLLG